VARQAELLVGIDVGTTMTKAAVVRSDGEEISLGSVPTAWRPVPTGAEANPLDFLDAVARATNAALELAPPGPVVGVGVTSMAETVVLLGKDGRPTAPAVAWHDRRGAEEAEQLAQVFGEATFSGRTGLPLSPLCTLVKLAWLSRHQGSAATRALSIADWVVHSLGGDQVAEASLASRTGALSLVGRSWWTEALEWATVPVDLFPPVVQAGGLAGHVTAEALQLLPGGTAPLGGQLERLRGAALASAGHDHLCVAAGAGALRPGELLDSCGSAEGFVRTVPPLDEAALRRAVSSGLSAGWHTLPDRYALLGGQSLGLLLGPVLKLLGVDDDEGVTNLDRAAAAKGPSSLRMLRDRPFASPSIVGIGADASPPALWAAALDVVSEGAARVVAAMDREAGPAEELVLTGGWSHLAGLRDRKGSLLPRARRPAVVEAGARGAALFGGCAAGLFPGPGAVPASADLAWADSPEGDVAPTRREQARPSATVTQR